jgi:hypothetical protein
MFARRYMLTGDRHHNDAGDIRAGLFGERRQLLIDANLRVRAARRRPGTTRSDGIGHRKLSFTVQPADANIRVGRRIAAGARAGPCRNCGLPSASRIGRIALRGRSGGMLNLALLAVLNSPLMWWFGWRHFIHMKDEALSNDQVKIAELPIAPGLLEDHAIKGATTRLLAAVDLVADLNTRVTDWLHQEFGTKPGANSLQRLTALNLDEFVAAVRAALPMGKKLTAADVAEIKREYGDTLEPAKSHRAEITQIERNLSDLVNASYALSAGDVEQMWKSAPPRMPFTPQGLAIEETASDESEDDDNLPLSF